MSAADRILNMITRGVVKAYTASARGFNTMMVSLLADDPPEVQHFTIHGLASSPQSGAEALVFQPSGNSDHLVALVSGEGPTRSAGETYLYNDHDWALGLLTNGLRLTGPSHRQWIVVTNSGIVLGGDGVTLPVARDGDTVVLDGALLTWLNAVAAAAFSPTPGTAVTPLDPGALAGSVEATSTKVSAE